MDIKTKEIYSEVNSVLNMLGDNYINKLPRSLYNMVVSEKLDTYNPTYDGTIALDKQNLKRESISMLAVFHLNYWCDSSAEKEELRGLLKNNENKYQAELRERYNPDNIFKKNNNQTLNEEKFEETNQLKEYKESTIKRFFYKILKILHIKK